MIVIDGHFIAFRALHSGVNLSSPDGTPSGILHIFVSVVMKLRSDFPDRTVEVIFDAKGPTHRHQMLKEYKGTRKPTPSELTDQVEVLKAELPKLGFNVYAIEGYEADDTIYTLVKDSPIGVLIVTKDKDLHQLVSDDLNKVVSVYDYQKGIKTTESDVELKYTVKASQMRDFLALAGDASDNIPGVPSVGPKTASTLLASYGDIDGIYANLDSIKGKLQSSLRDNRDLAYLSRDLTQLQYIPDLQPTLLANRDDAAAAEFLSTYGLKSLLKKHYTHVDTSNILSTVPSEEDTLPELRPSVLSGLDSLFYVNGEVYAIHDGSYQIVSQSSSSSDDVSSSSDIGSLMGDSKDNSDIASSSADDSSPMMSPSDLYNLIESRNDTSSSLLYYDYKGLLTIGLFDGMKPHILNEILPLDIMVLLWMTDTDSKSHLIKKDEASLDFIQRILCRYDIEQSNIGITEGRNSYDSIDTKLFAILVKMERVGISFNSEGIRDAADEISTRIREVEESIYSYIGYRINIASTKQLSDVLFGTMGLKPHKKIKTGFSTNEESIRALLRGYPEHSDLFSDILEYRELTKLLSTYTLKLLDFVGDDGRIRPIYNMIGAATGRISANNPNIQSIPAKGRYASRIRGAFQASSGYKLVGIDYSQVELRVLAHLCGDPELKSAFSNNEDIHSKTAIELFYNGDDSSDVSDMERRIAKAVNFSVIYGKTSFGLSQGLEIPMKDASIFIERYFSLYKGVKRYIDDTVERTTELGYTKTILGRVRVIHHIATGSGLQVAHAQRAAVNAPIQGSAADIIKLAMVQADNYIQDSGVDAHMLMQIHDELVFEVNESDAESFASKMEEIMGSVIDLDVPLQVNTSIGDNWGELK